ncbi:MAG: hypothetical protein QXI58_04435, partial [Candidatus Micrarchaeia archaeon]
MENKEEKKVLEVLIKELEKEEKPKADIFSSLMQMMVIPMVLPLLQQTIAQTLSTSTVNVNVQSSVTDIPITITSSTTIIGVDIRASTVTLNVNIESVSSEVVFNVNITGSVTLNVEVRNATLNINIGSMTREVTYGLEDSFPGTSVDTTKWTITRGTPSVSNSILVLYDPSVAEEIRSKKKFYPPAILTVRAKVAVYGTAGWHAQIGFHNPTENGIVAIYLGIATGLLVLWTDTGVSIIPVSWANDNNWHTYKLVFLSNRIEVWRDGILLGYYEGNNIPKQGGDGTGFNIRLLSGPGCELDVDWVEVTQEEFNRS